MVSLDDSPLICLFNFEGHLAAIILNAEFLEETRRVSFVMEEMRN
jgi:hypothetical protein